MGLQARLMSQALRKLAGTIGKTQTTLIFINQIRMKIGVVFGNPETTTGGNALKFYSSVRLDIRRMGAIFSATRSSCAFPLLDGKPEYASRFTPASLSSPKTVAPCPARFGTLT